MDNFLSHDPRIEEGTALRDLEKKVHWLMCQLAFQSLITDNSGGQMAFPDDLNVPDVFYDYADVQGNMVDVQKQSAGGGGKGLN
jgi:hypothetical protein